MCKIRREGKQEGIGILVDYHHPYRNTAGFSNLAKIFRKSDFWWHWCSFVAWRTAVAQ